MIDTPVLESERLRLRAVTEADLAGGYLDWLNDPEVTRFMETGKDPVTAAALRQYWERMSADSNAALFAIVRRSDDRHIGTVTINDINRRAGTANTGLMIGDKTCWGQGYAREAWSLVIDHAFRGLGLRRLIAGVIDGNGASLASLTSLGFQIEGRLRQHSLVDGQYLDVDRLGLLRDEFRPAHR